MTANNNIPGNPTPNLEAMDELASHLNQLDRKLEAILWKTLETHYRGLPPEAMAHWNRQRQKSLADGEAFPAPRDFAGCDWTPTRRPTWPA